MKTLIRLTRCLEMIETWNRHEPLAMHLKKYFSRHKEMGSTDRRVCREMVFNYFRLGKGLPQLKPEARLAVGNFIFNDSDDDTFKELVTAKTTLPLKDIGLAASAKFRIACEHYRELALPDLFPWLEHLSSDVDQDEWLDAFFVRPMVWVRVRKKFRQQILKEFDAMALAYTAITPGTFGFTAGEKITLTTAFKDGMIEIQDLSSQQTADYFKPGDKGEAWWDCCAGSGGKSLLLLDHLPDITLTVSDIRESILLNLKVRLKNAGFSGQKYLLADLTRQSFPELKFSSIILDAPCTGSGTWNRTPEMITLFDEQQIAIYAERQKSILTNILPSLNPGGKIIYITCSVFKEENEMITQFASKKLGLKILSEQLIKGYRHRADGMFVAELANKSLSLASGE